MSGLPSVVAGLLVFTVWVDGHGFSGIAGSAALVVLMLPTVTSTSEEILRTIPDPLREGGLALGAPQWRLIMQVVVPTALAGLMTAVHPRHRTRDRRDRADVADRVRRRHDEQEPAQGSAGRPAAVRLEAHSRPGRDAERARVDRRADPRDVRARAVRRRTARSRIEVNASSGGHDDRHRTDNRSLDLPVAVAHERGSRAGIARRATDQRVVREAQGVGALLAHDARRTT